MDLKRIDLAPHVRAAWTADGISGAFAKALGARFSLFPRQVHGTRVEWVDAPIAAGIEADGLLTNDRSFLVGVRTADCLPILLAHRREPLVGAIHAGWRGLAGGILDILAQRIAESGLRVADFALFLGPCIGPCCYEVGPEVGRCFGRHFNGKSLNLKAFARDRLTELGFGSILDEPICTRCTPSLPSYRRNPACGRMMTGIVIWNDNGCHVQGEKPAKMLAAGLLKE